MERDVSGRRELENKRFISPMAAGFQTFLNSVRGRKTQTARPNAKKEALIERKKRENAIRMI